MSKKKFFAVVITLAAVMYLGRHINAYIMPSIPTNPNLQQGASKVVSYATIHDPINPNVASVSTAGEVVVAGTNLQPNGASVSGGNGAIGTQDMWLRRVAEEQQLVQMEADANDMLNNEQSTSQRMGVEIR